MKKWILNLGLTTLAVLPIVAIASCSSTTNEIPTLTTEVAKYKNPFTAKDSAKTMTPAAAVESINKGSNTQKLAALQTLVTLQIDNQNFIYTVGEAKVDTNNRVDVSIKIAEKADPTKNQTINLIINGFATQVDTPLQTEAKRFQVSAPANETGKGLGTTATAAKINGATADADKLTELEKVTTVPTPTSGFTIKVVSAKVGTVDTTVEVTITVTQESDKQTMDATFTVTDFTPIQTGDALTEQAKLLIDQAAPEDKKAETPLEASKTIMTALSDYYKITLSQGITYNIKSATPNTTELTTLDVVLNVLSDAQGVTPITKDVKITGFTSPVTVLANKAKLIVDNTVIDAKNTETAEAASKLIKADTLVNYYADVPLGTGFSYAWKSNEVAGDTVKVTVTVSGPDPKAPAIDHTFTISAFKAAMLENLETEAAKFAISKEAKQGLNGTKITTRQVIFGINQQSNTQENKLKGINAIVDGFPEIATGLSLEIGMVSPVDALDTSTSVTIALTIKQTNTENNVEATFTITGLQAETLQQEITRLATTNLVTKAVLSGKEGETATQASGKITTIATLAPYYTLIPLPTGLQYNYVSNEVQSEDLKVTITVTSTDSNPVTTSGNKEVIITGFKTAKLAALETVADKLVTQQTKIPTQTAFQAKAAINNDTSLTRYYQTIPLGSGYGYNYGNKSEVDKTDPTTLNVTLRIRTSDNTLMIFRVVKITGFKEATAVEKEALKLQTSLAAKDPATLTTAAIVAVNNTATTQADKLTALKGLVTNFPEITSGYTLAIGRPLVDTTTLTSVNIPITITAPEGVEGNPTTVTFTITNLTDGTSEQKLAIVRTLLNNRTVVSGKETETAETAKNTITNDQRLNQYYQNTQLPPEFSYRYGNNSVINSSNNRTLDVTLFLIFEGTTHNVVVEISGFAAPAEAL